MEEKAKTLTNPCNFAGVSPIMMDLPYPPVQVGGRNQAYAELLKLDYCGAVSELSAITQYINNENRLSCEKCPVARTILGIAVAEMVHLQKLGELIFLLGGNVDFIVKQRNGKRQIWTPEHLVIPGNLEKMLRADIESEKEAINQYRAHIKMIKDQYINDVLARIIQDEEYHIVILTALLKQC